MFVQSHIQRVRHHHHHHHQQTAATASSQSIANNHSIASSTSSKSLGPLHTGHAQQTNKHKQTTNQLDHNRQNNDRNEKNSNKILHSQKQQKQLVTEEPTSVVAHTKPTHSTSDPGPDKRIDIVTAIIPSGRNLTQPGNRLKSTTSSSSNLDGESSNRQMGSKSFQQHYRTATVDQQRERLLTFSETIHRQTTLATTTTVRLRSASLSKPDSQAQLLPSKLNNNNNQNRASSSSWLAFPRDVAKKPSGADQHQQTARISLQLKFAAKSAIGVSGRHAYTRKAGVNRSSKHSCIKRKTLRVCSKRRNNPSKGAHWALLCSFIEQISINTNNENRQHSKPTRLATNFGLSNLSNKFNKTLFQFRNFSLDSFKHILYLIILFANHLVAFHWETARQILKASRAEVDCKTSSRPDNDTIDMRHSNVGQRRIQTIPLEAQAVPLLRTLNAPYCNNLAHHSCLHHSQLAQPGASSLDNWNPHHHQHHHHQHNHHHHPAESNFLVDQHGDSTVNQHQRYRIVSDRNTYEPSTCLEFTNRQARQQQQMCAHLVHSYPTETPKLIYLNSDSSLDARASSIISEMPIPLSSHLHKHRSSPGYHHHNDHQTKPNPQIPDKSFQPYFSPNWNWPMGHTIDESSSISRRQTERDNVDYQSDQSDRDGHQAALERRNLAVSGWQRTCISSPTLYENERVGYRCNQDPNKPTITFDGCQKELLLAPLGAPDGAMVTQALKRPDNLMWQEDQIRYHSVDESSGRYINNRTSQRHRQLSHHNDGYRNPNNPVAPLERRLSSIIGSDSELCKRKPQMSTNFSSSSSLSSGANLVRAVTARTKDLAPSYQESASRVMLNRRRLNRQASSTASEASFSHYGAYVKSDRSPVSQGGSARTHLLHHSHNHSHNHTGVGYCASMQNRVSAHMDMDTKSQQLGSHLNYRLSTSQVSVGGNGNGNQIANSQQRTTTAGAKQRWDDNQCSKTNAQQSCGADGSGQKKNGNLGVSGKSKSMNHQHSPIGVASTLGKVSLAGAKRRLGFKQNRGLNSLSVHRSEEIFPSEASEMLARQYTSTTTTTTTGSNSLNDSCDLELTPKWLSRFGSESPDPKVCFVEGLGLGQIASRQALVSPYLGDIQVSLSDRRGMLEVEIIRVRQLQPKPYAKRLPSVYVKVYLMKNKKCLAKFKTSQISHTLDPLYQQLFIFRDDYSNCVLQIIVWGDYGKNDRKSLMGIVQIHLNDLDMSNVVIGWYKLFNAPSMVASIANSSKSLRQTLSTTKLADLSISQQ